MPCCFDCENRISTRIVCPLCGEEYCHSHNEDGQCPKCKGRGLPKDRSFQICIDVNNTEGMLITEDKVFIDELYEFIEKHGYTIQTNKEWALRDLGI